MLAGRVTFSIRNSTSRPLEWEILDGVMVIDERENIAPGSVQNLSTKLAPGDYRITCGLIRNPKGSLHVSAISGAQAKVAQLDLVGPLAEYRVFASYEIDGLVDDTRRIAEALNSAIENGAPIIFDGPRPLRAPRADRLIFPRSRR